MKCRVTQTTDRLSMTLAEREEELFHVMVAEVGNTTHT